MPIVRASGRQIETVETPNHPDANREEWISEPGGLSQFGAFIHVLQPGTRSSIKHWHQAEDELIYVIDGQLTVIEGDRETVIGPGDAATFPHGVAQGHYLWNRSDRAVTCLVVGTRAAVDRITYPDHDRVMLRDRSEPDDVWTDTAGNPARSAYAGWDP